MHACPCERIVALFDHKSSTCLIFEFYPQVCKSVFSYLQFGKQRKVCLILTVYYKVDVLDALDHVDFALEFFDT